MTEVPDAVKDEQVAASDKELLSTKKELSDDSTGIIVENDEKPVINGNSAREEELHDNGSRDSSEEELGLLEKPVEILSRKRERKSTERYVDKTEEKPKPDDELDYSQGKGVKLGDIEFIRHALDKILSDELKPLHRLLYRREGKATMVKKNIRGFCGYPFAKDSNHYAKILSQVERINNAGLKVIMGVLGLEKKGDREELKTRLVEFLMDPRDLGKSVPQKKSTKAANKKKTPTKKKRSSSSGKKEKTTDEVSSASENSEDSDGEDIDEVKKNKKKSLPKKKDTKESKKNKTQVKIAAPKTKKKSPKKELPKNQDAKRKNAEDDTDDDDDAPLSKKNKCEPTNDDLKSVVADILKDADLEQVTMKTVCRQVYDRFPDFDLTSRKDFIKTTVKEIIS